MNQSKKLLAALVAVPASVVVADSAFAADVTLNFEINNEFVGGKAVSATAVKDTELNTVVVDALTEGMNDFKKTITIELSKVTADKAKEEVEKYFDYLKSNVNSKVNNYDTTMLYGMFEKAAIKVVETGEGANQKTTVTVTMAYYGTAEDVSKAQGLGITVPSTSDTPNTLDKVKAVHDYVVSTMKTDAKKHSMAQLVNNKSGSSHAYSMLMYTLLKKQNISDVKYVYGMKSGMYQSWNVVKIGDKWYNLDAFSNDTTASTSTEVKYRYFLTNNLGEHRITIGGKTEDLTAIAYNHLATVDNKAVSENFIYYVDDKGKIQKINKKTLELITTSDINIEATVTPGNLYYVKYIENANVNETEKEALYFINTARGHQIYEYDISTQKTSLVVRNAVESFTISTASTNPTISYELANGTSKVLYLKDIAASYNNEIKAVQKALDEMETAAEITKDNKVIGKVNPSDTFTKLKAGLEDLKENLASLKENVTTKKQELLVANDTAKVTLEGDIKKLEDDIKKLEDDIKKLENEISELTSKIVDLTAKVKKARELYVALTNEQKKEANVANQIKNLEKLEELLFPTTGVGDNESVNSLINVINTLDNTNPRYYADIVSAQAIYNTLSPTQKALVYNAPILEKAQKDVTAVNQLVADYIKLLGANKTIEDAFTNLSNFITKIEELAVRYSYLLPSLQGAVNSKTEGHELADAIAEAKIKRTNIESNRLKLSNTDETTADYLAVIKDVLEAYNKMTISEKALFTEAEVAKITAANSSTESITDLAESLKGDLAEVNLDELITLDLFEKITTLSAQYNSLTPAQKAELNGKASDLIKKLQDFETKFIAVKGKTELKTIEDNIGKIVSNKPKNIADFQTTIVAIQESIKTFESANKLSGSIEKFYSNKQISQTFATYEEAIADKTYNAATTLEAAIKALKDPVKMETVMKLRSEYNTINPLLKGYISISLLETQEVRIITAEIKKLKEDAALADVLPVYNLYMSISEDARKKVAEADSKRLIELYQKAVANDTATKDAIKKVQEMVDKLGSQTTREQLDALIEAYDALDKESQKQIVGYDDKVKAVEERLTAQEEADKDRLAAQNVTTMIATLNEESSEEDILEAREAYDALTDAAKDLISKGTLELLEYYESRMDELIELAEKEAQVVIDRINRITSSYTETQIKSIRVAHTALSALAKKFVTQETLQKLIDAENNIIYQNTVVKQAKIDANAFDVYMNDINRNSTTAEIAKARAYYNRLSQEARKHVITLEKLVRLETMWKDPEYLELVYTYYPEYIHAVKPGAIVTQKPTYDPLYIPDDSSSTPSTSPSVATNYPASASWSAYETMRYQNGRYTTTITSTQVKNIADRNMRLKADNIEIVIPTADLKASTATVGVSVNVSNNQLNIQFTEGNNAKYFSDYVEIHVPFSVLKGNASQIIERVSAFGSAASFKVDGSTFIIRTKSSGTFRAASASTYNDIPSGEQGTAIRELAKRGIKFDTTSRLSQSYKQVTKMDVALMIATALDLSSNAKSKYLDLESDLHVKRAQGLLEAGVMSGATSARFNPNGIITKQEAAIIIANMYRYLNQDLAKAYNKLNSSYRDVANLTLEARQSIAILELFGVVSGTGLFEPTQALTRGEFAELLYKALTAINYL